MAGEEFCWAGVTDRCSMQQLENDGVASRIETRLSMGEDFEATISRIKALLCESVQQVIGEKCA